MKCIEQQTSNLINEGEARVEDEEVGIESISSGLENEDNVLIDYYNLYFELLLIVITLIVIDTIY